MNAVTVYSQPGCMPCRATKRWLAKRGVPFTEVDVTHSPADAEAIRALGYQQAPVVVVSLGPAGEDVHWSGHNPDRLAEHTTTKKEQDR